MDVLKSKKDFCYIRLKRVSGYETLFRRMQQVFLGFSQKSIKFNFFKDRTIVKFL